MVRDVCEAVMYKGGVVRNPGESRTLACYGLDFPEPPRDAVSLVLLHPAPHDISAVHVTKTDFLGNGDELYPSFYLRDANTLFDVLDGKTPLRCSKRLIVPSRVPQAPQKRECEAIPRLCVRQKL